MAKSPTERSRLRQERKPDEVRAYRREWTRRRARAVRQALLDRDGPLCQWCDEPMEDPFDGDATHVDHINPRKRGGGKLHDRYKLPPPVNIRLLHAGCNMERKARQEPGTSEIPHDDEVPF